MKLTRRGELVFKVLLIVGIVALALGVDYYLDHMWWQDEGFCWGTYLECEGGR